MAPGGKAALLPGHRGEGAAQASAGHGEGVVPIRDLMPDQHRVLFALLRHRDQDPELRPR